MTTKIFLRPYVWSVLIAVVVACGTVPTERAANTPTATQAPTLMPVSPTPTILPVTSTLTSSLPVSSPPDGLRMAYIINGNLYFQDGNEPPLQLTNSGEDSVLFLSENGEKVFFLRGVKPPFDLYSINIDGTSEQVLVTNDLLQALDTSYTESTAFHSVSILPNTHLLLFGTHEIQSNASLWNNDLLRVDTDTAEIKRLLPPGQVSSFYVSPDGQFIAIDSIGAINIIDGEGKYVHRDLVTYTPSEPTFLAPGISWMPDSKGLVVLLPAYTVYETSASGPSYTVWRYTLDNDKGVQVPLDVLPTEVYMATVSPDGNWILYNNTDQNAFYIGDLRTGGTQLYEPSTFAFHYEQGWSPDSKHFIYRGMRNNLFLGSINSSPKLIGKGELLGWLDSNRYLYYVDKNIAMGNISGPKDIILDNHEFFQVPTIFTFILP